MWKQHIIYNITTYNIYFMGGGLIREGGGSIHFFTQNGGGLFERGLNRKITVGEVPKFLGEVLKISEEV